MKLLAFCMALSMSASLSLHAQHITLTQGNLDFLQNEKHVKIEFRYDSMKVGKFDKEEDFIHAKKEEYNSKDPGKGDAWAKKWVDDRFYKFEFNFKEIYNKNSSMQVDTASDAKYTMIVHTIFTEPGFSTGWLVKKNAEITADVIIAETANRNNILAVVHIDRAPGNAYGLYDFDTGTRINAAYGRAAKALAKFIGK